MVDRNLFFSPLTTAADVAAVTASISSGPDDGANNKLAAYYKTSLRHASTQQGISNILKVKEATTVVLGGHGTIGLLDTGKGQGYSADLTRKLSEQSRKDWESHAQRIYEARRQGFRINELEILSCDTGAEETGAYVLWLLAKIADLQQVRARTGITTLYTQGSRRWLEFEQGSFWQAASNTMYLPPPAIAVPVRSAGSRTAKGYFEIIEQDAVKSIAFDAVTGIQLQLLSGEQAQEVEVTDTVAFLDRLFLTDQMAFDGDVLAEVTAKISLLTADKTIDIHVYNKRFAVFPGYGAAFYAGALTS